MSSSPNNKRKQSESSIDESPITSSQQAAAPPPMVALPPPLMQYPNGQIIPYYYHPQQQPFYYPISPQQHPFATETTNVRKSSTPRILPKTINDTITPLSSPAGALYPQPPPSPFYHPYALQMSPTMIPTYRHDSVSSSPGLGPTNSTADQREKARKVSHSAIERRRRERINDKIIQLKQLIPTCAEQDNLHKMSILQSAIDYIAYLKDIVKTLDEHGTEATTNQLLKGDHLRIKMVKSMLPKEVEPFTTQFSVHSNTEEPKRALKPMDVIKSATPLTPPQETAAKPAESSPTLEPKHMSLQNILC